MMRRFLSDTDHIYLACGVTDFRKQISGLVAMVHMQFRLDPYKGSCAFIFCNKKRNGIKILRYDSNGFILASHNYAIIRITVRSQYQALRHGKKSLAVCRYSKGSKGECGTLYHSRKCPTQRTGCLHLPEISSDRDAKQPPSGASGDHRQLPALVSDSAAGMQAELQE